MKIVFFLSMLISCLILGCADTDLPSPFFYKIPKKFQNDFSSPPTKIPVPYAVDAPLLGNGFLGVAISGHPEEQTYHLARNDFWRLKSGLNESFPAVLGTLKINIPEIEGFDYQVKQDLYRAITYSIFSNENREISYKSFVSANEDLLVIQVKYKGVGKIKGYLSLRLPGENELIDNPPFDIIFPAKTEETIANSGIHFISRSFVEGVDIKTRSVAALKLIGGQSKAFELTDGQSVYIAMASSSNFKSQDAEKKVVDRLEKLDIHDLKAAENAHLNWWKEFWAMSDVQINHDIIEKQYHLSNYTLASFSRDPDFPPSIFGTTITKERPHWNGDYHLNYNHYAPYYGLFSSNHIEQAFPCSNTLLAQIERGNYYAEKICGIKKGIMLPVGAGPLGIETTRKNELMVRHRSNWFDEGNVEDEGLFFGQKSNSAYAVVNMAYQFYYTYNMAYTKKVYPFVKGVATFWENYLTFENGRYVIYNDAIHEGTVGTKNPILSLGLVRMVLQTAIDMSVELGIDQDKKKVWENMIENLSPYSYQEREGKKVFRYTEKGTDWWNDNTLGIQHIYPAGQIGLNSDPELLKVAHQTIDVMQRWIDYNGSNSFFPAAVRVGYDPHIILDQLEVYSNNTYSNGYQLNNPHGIENLSTVPNTINEMLCMGHQGVLRVFAVWPLEKNASFKCLRVQGAFLVSSKLENGEVDFIEIKSEKGRNCRVENPWKGEVQVYRNGEKSEVLTGEILEFQTSIAEVLKLERVYSL